MKNLFNRIINIVINKLAALKHLKLIRVLINAFMWLKKHLPALHPKHLVGLLDWYIIKKFIGTYVFSIILIISIAIIFDFNENLSKLTEYKAPWHAIIFDYYANFVPYYSNLFSPLFVFIAVIFFTSKLAGNSEIISMLASGVSFNRLLRPYMISCILIAGLTYYLNSSVIPHGTVIRLNFRSLYLNSKKNTAAENVQLKVAKNTVAYIQNYDDKYKRGYGFSLDKFDGNKLVDHLTASEIQYDTIADSKISLENIRLEKQKIKGVTRTYYNRSRKRYCYNDGTN